MCGRDKFRNQNQCSCQQHHHHHFYINDQPVENLEKPRSRWFGKPSANHYFFFNEKQLNKDTDPSDMVAIAKNTVKEHFAQQQQQAVPAQEKDSGCFKHHQKERHWGHHHHDDKFDKFEKSHGYHQFYTFHNFNENESPKRFFNKKYFEGSFLD
jgi:hypothetical protein